MYDIVLRQQMKANCKQTGVELTTSQPQEIQAKIYKGLQSWLAWWLAWLAGSWIMQTQEIYREQKIACHLQKKKILLNETITALHVNICDLQCSP